MVLKYYFATVKYNKGKSESVTVEDYVWFTELVEKKGIYKRHAFEEGKTGRLHLHVVFESRSNLYLKQFMREGYSVKFVEVYDSVELLKYIDKLDYYSKSTRKLDNKTLISKGTTSSVYKDLSNESLGYIDLEDYI